MERARFGVLRNDVDDLGHRHGGPVHADEVAVGIVAVGFAVASQAAVGAVRAAAFRVGQQQVQAARAFAAVHATAHDAQRDRGRVGQLHVLGRFHVRREVVVVGQVDAFRWDIVGLDVFAVTPVDGRLARQPRLHGVERIVIGVRPLFSVS